MRAKRKEVYGIPAICLILIILWNENWSFWYMSRDWPTHDENGQCDRILLVADPQLIGYKREFYGKIARWDSDRYLSTGFSYAVAKFQPHAVIFLGDLFDEGLDASEEEWNDTYERFVSIFETKNNENRVYIAGDNDIGGESEMINELARNKFSNYFRNNYSYLEQFYNINEVYLFDTKGKRVLTESKNSNQNHPPLNILLTHIPYLASSYRSSKIGENIDLILSAHDHTTGIYEFQRTGPKAVLFTRVSDASPTYKKTVGENEPQIELKTPTCSYRMGVASMGYGALTICRNVDFSNETQIEFSVFWLPNRFVQLFLYMVTVIFCLAWILYYKRYRSKRYAWLQ